MKTHIENKIYLLQVEEKLRNGVPLTKVGDTHRDVEQRNNETIVNASLHRTNDLTYWKAQKHDGTMFRDKKLHKFLEDKGFEREINDNGNKSEWFYDLSEEAFEKLFEEFIGEKPHKEYTLRPAQENIFNKVQDAWKEDYRYFNLDACVRVGKSILSLHIAKTFNMFPCYIGKNLTSQKSVQKDNSEFSIVKELLTQSIHGIDEITEDDSKRAQQIISNIIEANTQEKKVMFFVDEVDDASHTQKSRELIRRVTEKIKEMNLFGAFITMSGTRSYRGLKVLNDLNPDKVKEIDLAYYEMQRIQPECTCERDFKNISIYASETELLSISDALKNNKGRTSLAENIKLILGENSFNIETNPDFPHFFIKFATIGKGNANSLVRILNRSYSNIENKKYKYFNINGDTTNSKEAEEFCHKKIEENGDAICVFVTQGMATTSFSVKTLGNSIVFSDNELTADDIQSLHRSCTWAEGKDKANLIYITTCDSLELKFDDIFEDELKASTDKEDKNQMYKEILERNCITHYMVNNDSITPVVVTEQNIELVLDRKAKQMTKVSNLVRLMLEDSEAIMDALQGGNMKGSISHSSKSTTAKGSQVDVFGLGSNKKTTKAKSSEMTQSALQKIFREVAERIVLVPVMSRIHETELGGDIGWEKLGISKDIYNSLMVSMPLLKERIETIYNLCSEDEYLDENYLDTYMKLR